MTLGDRSKFTLEVNIRLQLFSVVPTVFRNGKEQGELSKKFRKEVPRYGD